METRSSSRCGRSHFKLNGLPADEFPTLAEVDFYAGLAVTGKDAATG